MTMAGDDLITGLEPQGSEPVEDAPESTLHKFVCPECGNTDLTQMRLTIVDKCWERYDYVEPTDDEPELVPLFQYGKNDYAEADPDEKPTMYCWAWLEDSNGNKNLCDGVWTVDWGDFEIG